MNSCRNTDNVIVIGAYDDAKREGEPKYVDRLRKFNATVWETKNYYLLQSYTTCVAAIDKQSGILYDFMRYIYRYSPMSAQHISKFATDYHATQRYTYRP